MPIGAAKSAGRSRPYVHPCASRSALAVAGVSEALPGRERELSEGVLLLCVVACLAVAEVRLVDAFAPLVRIVLVFKSAAFEGHDVLLPRSRGAPYRENLRRPSQRAFGARRGR